MIEARILRRTGRKPLVVVRLESLLWIEPPEQLGVGAWPVGVSTFGLYARCGEGVCHRDWCSSAQPVALLPWHGSLPPPRGERLRDFRPEQFLPKVMEYAGPHLT